MIPRKRRGAHLIAPFHQGANTRKDAFDIATGRWPGEIAIRRVEDKIDFFAARLRLKRHVVDQGIGGADHRNIAPGYREHHAAVAGMRHHNRGFAGDKRTV